MYRKKSVPWTSQPGVFTGFSAPWNRGLKFAFEASLGKRDLVTNYASGPVSGVSFSGGVKGVQANFSGSQADKSCTFGVHHGMDGATEATWDVLVYFSGANPTGIICGQWDGYTQEWLLQASSGSLIWVPADDNLTNRTRFDLSSAFPTAGWYRIICSWWSTSSKLLLINGVDKTTSLSVVSTGAANIGTNNTTDELQIGMASGNSALNGAVVFARAWNVKKTLAELQDLHNVPWRIFKPLPGYFPVAAAGYTPKTLTATISAALSVGRTATASLGAAIRSGQSMTASASAVISVANTVTANVSAAIRADHSAAASISAAIRADRTAGASLSAAIQSAATASATLSGAIQTAQSATSGLTAYIVASGARSSSASLSAAISDARTATSSLSAAVATARTATAALDSAIQIEATASTGASAAIREAFSLSANLSGAVQTSATASASLAAVVATTNAISSGLSAAVQAEQTAFAALSAYIAADVVLTQAEVDMLTDIWQRFGLDPLAPLTETETSASFGGIVLSKSGTNPITSTRSGNSAAGVASSMILDVWQRLGLDPDNPMTASETQISAGTLSQARAVSGATVTVTRAP